MSKGSVGILRYIFFLVVHLHANPSRLSSLTPWLVRPEKLFFLLTRNSLLKHVMVAVCACVSLTQAKLKNQGKLHTLYVSSFVCM